MKKLLMVIPLVFLICFAFGCQKDEEVAEGGLTEEEVNAIIGEVLKAWNNADMDACANAYSTDVVFSNPLQGETIGLDAFKEMIRSYHDERASFNLSIDEMFTKNDKFAVLWSTNETLMSGAEMKVSGMSTGRFEEGKIAEETLYFDTKKVLEHMGFKVIPPEEPEKK